MPDGLSITEVQAELAASKSEITVTSNGTVRPYSRDSRDSREQENSLSGLYVEVRRMDSRDSQLFEVDRCIRKLKKRCEKDGLFGILRERQYYQKPSEIRRKKIKEARRLMKRNKRKQAEKDAVYENSKFVPRKSFEERSTNDSRRNIQQT